MSFGTRLTAAAPLLGATLAAVALGGVAVFTVQNAGCPDPGHYTGTTTQITLVGGCLDPNDLPAAPTDAPAPAGAALDRDRQVRP